MDACGEILRAMSVNVKIWYSLDWINEVPHNRSGTFGSQIYTRFFRTEHLVIFIIIYLFFIHRKRVQENKT